MYSVTFDHCMGLENCSLPEMVGTLNTQIIRSESNMPKILLKILSGILQNLSNYVVSLSPFPLSFLILK